MSYQSVVLADSPLAYYRMDASSGTSETDASSNGHTGTYSNGTAGGFVLAQAGGTRNDTDTAAQFVAAKTGVLTLDTLGSLGSGLATSTFECLIKTTTTSTQCLFGTVNTGTSMIYEVFLNKDVLNATVVGTTTLKVRGTGGLNALFGTTAAHIYDGNWHHLVWVLSGTVSSCTCTCYCDGVSVGISTFQTNPFNFGAFGNFGFNMTVAAENVRGTVGSYADVSLDEVAFYSTALSSSQVSTHYKAARAYVDASAGQPTLSGTGVEKKLYGDSRTASVAPSGSEAGARTGADVLGGQLTPAGSQVEAGIFRISPTASLTTAGSIAAAKIAADSASGIIIPSGVELEACTFRIPCAGGITVAGATLESGGETYSLIASLTAAGSLGQILLQGSNPSGILLPRGAASDAWSQTTSKQGIVVLSGSISDRATFTQTLAALAALTGVLSEHYVINHPGFAVAADSPRWTSVATDGALYAAVQSDASRWVAVGSDQEV